MHIAISVHVYMESCIEKMFLIMSVMKIDVFPKVLGAMVGHDMHVGQYMISKHRSSQSLTSIVLGGWRSVVSVFRVVVSWWLVESSRWLMVDVG